MIDSNFSMSELPFVAPRDGGTLNLWDVTPTGDFQYDLDQGHEFAEAFYDFMVQADAVGIFAMIVAAMPQEQSGIEVGFLTAIAERAAA